MVTLTSELNCPNMETDKMLLSTFPGLLTILSTGLVVVITDEVVMAGSHMIIDLLYFKVVWSSTQIDDPVLDMLCLDKKKRN